MQQCKLDLATSSSGFIAVTGHFLLLCPRFETIDLSLNGGGDDEISRYLGSY
jgi:hypothetical protein